ncbi:MAG: crossover junction endodeoxyribonuclease RuvC [Candidatus Anaerobiospirillum pullicola]|uniref:Crossover junction endodeoxyribonuclease RuvC n=1 Tax=Candidatus Anaerobiospirillum pullicola TaxID=2838451 RepID=A0A948TEL0_9GAMM|nr:crossover junction endodeoxyribonuclease RuvC [Candidatus Anaerobiospirillum pullicola]
MAEIILGIDPGSRKTGYGVLHMQGNQLTYLGSGCIVMDTSDPIAERMLMIFEAVSSIIEQFHPTVMAVEEAFLSKNVQATIKLAEARSAAMVAGARLKLPVYEYTPMQIKQAVVGYGAAEKYQVQFMVTKILHLNGRPQADAADALACAICHGYTYKVSVAMGAGVQIGSSVRGRLRQGR